MNPTPKVSSQYGAPMGRIGCHHLDISEPLSLTRIRLNRGGYDAGGAYWGNGAPLYGLSDAGDNWRYFRAIDRKAAKEKAIAMVCEAEGCDPTDIRFHR